MKNPILRDALISLKQSPKFQTMLVEMNQSQKQARFNYLKSLVEFKFAGEGVPFHMNTRADIVKRANAAIARISGQADYGYEQAVSRIKNAWKNPSCFRLAEQVLR